MYCCFGRHSGRIVERGSWLPMFPHVMEVFRREKPVGSHGLGVRLIAGVFLSVAAAGCEVPGTRPKADDKAQPPAAAGGNWIVVDQGERPKDEPKPVPNTAEKKDPTEIHLPTLPHTEPLVHPEPVCTGTIRTGTIAPLTVDAGPGTAKVSWYHPGDTSVVTYRLTSISQRLVVGRQAELRWQEIKPGKGCSTLTATVTGLDRRTPYVFSLDVVRTVTWDDVTRAATIARSGAITTR
jgi:hypothetical protein